MERGAWSEGKWRGWVVRVGGMVSGERGGY